MGFLFAFGPNWQGGEFIDTCNCPSFKDGTKFGFSFGFLYEQDLSSAFQWGAASIFNNLGLIASYKQSELIDAVSPSTGKSEKVTIWFRQEAKTNFWYSSLVPYLKWSPSEYFFVKLGFSASYVFYSHLSHTKELLTTSVRLGNGEPVNVKFTESGSTMETVYDGRFPALNPLQFGIEPMVGLNLFIGKNVFLSPGFWYSLPLTTLSSKGADFKSNSWRIFLELRWAFSMRTKRN